MSVRLPSGEAYAGQVAKESLWLPKFQPHLSFEIPSPVGIGVPSRDYPYPWSVNRWIIGETVSEETVEDKCRLARDLARFLKELQEIDTTNGPLAGEQNFYRGGNLSVYHEETQKALEQLEDLFPKEKLAAIWDRALGTHWADTGVWVHGDIAVGNLLVREGQLEAVIDFGILGVGDPACDYVMAWTFFDEESRSEFKRALSCEEATWERSQGWALWKALISYQKEESESPQSLWALKTIQALLEDERVS